MVSLKLNFSNRILYTLLAITLILIVAGIAIALNSNNPAIHGHSADEIQDLRRGKINCTEHTIASGTSIDKLPGGRSTTGNTYCDSKSSTCIRVHVPSYHKLSGWVPAESVLCSKFLVGQSQVYTSVSIPGYVIHCCNII